MKKVSLFLAAVFAVCTLTLIGCDKGDHASQLKSDMKELGHDAKRAVQDATD